MAIKGANKNKQASRVFIVFTQIYVFHILTINCDKKTAIAFANGGWRE
jgi:hypothetical protein